jgi:uncharacterized RDD family membrane protein YckC
MELSYVPSTWNRLIAKAIDQVASVIFFIPFFGKVITMLFTDEDVYISLPMLLFLLFIPAIYEALFLALMQRTPGKWMMGLKVVPNHDANENLRWDQCVLRPLTGRLSLFFSLAIYATAFFRYDRTHLADWVAETRVVQATPRRSRTNIRWLLGSLCIVMYTYEGINSAINVFDNIDWEYHDADLRGILQLDDLIPQDLDL